MLAFSLKCCCATLQSFCWELQYLQYSKTYCYFVCVSFTSKVDIYPNDWYCIKESISSFIVYMDPTGWGKTESYSNWEGLSTTDSGSNRKCFWVILPVRVSIVTTGKPIWRVQRFMMSWTEWGIYKPGVLSTAWKQTEGSRNIRRNTRTPKDTMPDEIMHICGCDVFFFFKLYRPVEGGPTSLYKLCFWRRMCSGKTVKRKRLWTAGKALEAVNTLHLL